MTKRQSVQGRSMMGVLAILVTIMSPKLCVSEGQQQQQQQQYFYESIKGGEMEMPVAAVNPTSQQYIIYNRATGQTQQQQQQHSVDHKMGVQNVQQQQHFFYSLNQPQQAEGQLQQQKEQHLQHQLTHKLFPVSNVSNQQQQQQQQQPLVNNNNKIQLITNGNSLSTLPSSSSSSGTLPPSSVSLAAGTSTTVTNPFQPLLPIDIISDIHIEDYPHLQFEEQQVQCLNCCQPNEDPCTSCCDTSPLLNANTLKSLAG